MKNSILGSIMLFGLLAAPSGAYANTKSDPLPIGLHGKGASVSAMTRSSEAWQSVEKAFLSWHLHQARFLWQCHICRFMEFIGRMGCSALRHLFV